MVFARHTDMQNNNRNVLLIITFILFTIILLAAVLTAPLFVYFQNQTKLTSKLLKVKNLNLQLN